MRPHAREEALLVQEVGDELVVYDQERHRAHRLNRTAALVFRRCDGRKTVAELAALVQEDSGLPEGEGLVWLALDRLEKAHLLRERLKRPAKEAGITRRRVMRKLGVAGVLSFLLPVVTTLAVPTPAMAGTPARGCCEFRPTGCAVGVTQAQCEGAGGTFFAGATACIGQPARCGTPG